VDKDIKSVADLKGKNVGVWLGGNEFELFAALVKNGMDPQNAADVTIVQQPFDMTLLLKGDVDAAAAMIYNEYAQVLEQIIPRRANYTRPKISTCSTSTRKAPPCSKMAFLLIPTGWRSRVTKM